MKNLLVIDDDEDDREFFLSVLEKIGGPINCQVAMNGHVALEHLKQGAYRPHLIFLDLNMPVMNGWEFLREIKNIEGLRGIPVVVLSTSSNEATIHEAIGLGAVDFITKPNKLSILEQRLKAVIDNPFYFQ